MGRMVTVEEWAEIHGKNACRGTAHDPQMRMEKGAERPC